MPRAIERRHAPYERSLHSGGPQIDADDIAAMRCARDTQG